LAIVSIGIHAFAAEEPEIATLVAPGHCARPPGMLPAAGVPSVPYAPGGPKGSVGLLNVTLPPTQVHSFGAVDCADAGKEDAEKETMAPAPRHTTATRETTRGPMIRRTISPSVIAQRSTTRKITREHKSAEHEYPGTSKPGPPGTILRATTYHPSRESCIRSLRLRPGTAGDRL
jgi:hypothetical protein